MNKIAKIAVAATASALFTAQAFAGDPTGANYHIDRVSAGYTDVYDIRMAGGEPAIISISGDGDTDLDLRVFDQNGNQVCSSTSYHNDESCHFYPRATAQYTIEVANLGDAWTRYSLRTN